ncbi:MAG: HD-GYP domain-containing protein [Nitrospirae bacterium]|nr:MAG: HD-GYP domain-containing protein [Nitrospirota bacterium]
MSDIKIKEAPVADEQAQPILTHERSLSQKIARGSEASDILDQQMVMLGIQLVTQLNVLIKTSRIYERTNAALDKPVDAMLTLIKTMAQDQPVTLRLQNDFLFLGNSHLKVNAQQMAVATSIIDALNAWKIGGMTFLLTVESKDLREFAALFVSLDPDNKTIEDLQKEITARGIVGIELEEQRQLQIRQGPGTAGDTGSGTAGNTGPGTAGGTGPGTAGNTGPDGTGSTDLKVQRKMNAMNGYAKVAGSVGTLTQASREGGTASFKQAKRAIQNIIDLMVDDEAAVLGLTTLRCHDQYTHNHSVNVSLLSIALANRVGYPKVELADLGLAALFHDMGKSTIPMEVLNKPGEFTDDDWVAMRNHPTEGVLSLSKMRGITNLPGRMAAASFEHHMNQDFSGYPKLTVPWTISLTGRILTIADCYDAMTSSRVYRREPMSPSKVLNMMLSKSGKSFDPVLLKLFVNCVGIIPIGSLVMLETSELAVVLKPAADKANGERPIVRVITDPQGNSVDHGREVDLTEKDETGDFRHNVIRLIDNTEYKFDTSRYFT